MKCLKNKFVFDNLYCKYSLSLSPLFQQVTVYKRFEGMCLWEKLYNIVQSGQCSNGAGVFDEITNMEIVFIC